MFFIPIFIYVGIIVLALVLSSKKQRNEDFLYPKKRFGPWKVAFSAWSTGESCWWALGLTGLGYVVGLQSLWFVLGETVFACIMWYVIAPRFYCRCERIGARTVGAYFAHYFHDNNYSVRMVVAVILFCIVPLYISAQYAGISKVSEYFSLDSYRSIFILFAALFVVYSLIGGFYVMSSLSVFHGILMLLFIVMISILLAYSFFEHKIQYDARLLSNDFFWNVWGKGGFDRASFLKALSQFMAGVGFLGAPNIFAKFLNARGPETIKKAAPIGVMLFVLGDTLAVCVGITGRFIFSALSNGEMLVPTIAVHLLPSALAGVIFIGVIAAIYSTADSLLLLISSWFVNEIYQNILNNKASCIRGNYVARGVMIICVTIGLLISFADNRLIFWMVNFVWVVISCTFAPLVVMACYLDSIDSFTATTGLLVGLITAAVWNMFCVEMTGASGLVPGLLFNLIAVVVLHGRKAANENTP